MQKEKEEAKQRCDAMERDKLRTERQLEDTSTQVHTQFCQWDYTACTAVCVVGKETLTSLANTTDRSIWCNSFASDQIIQQSCEQ